MANEIRTQISQSVTNGSLSDSVSISFQTDQATAASAGGVQIVGTSAETLNLGDVSSVGPMVLVNLDATNYVEFGIDSTGFVPIGRIDPGEAAVYRPSVGTTPYVRANTADVKIRRLIPSL